MTELSESGDVKRKRSHITLLEVLIILLVLGTLVALMLPAVEAAREPARRVQCGNQLKWIALALHNYAQANRNQFPPGTICGPSVAMPGNQYDVWGEAGKTRPGNHGTSFLLRLLPFVEEEKLFKTWASGEKGSGTTVGCWSPAGNAGTKSIPGPAIKDIKMFYCPTRRSMLRSEDSVMMLSSTWTGGGTDYGGCAGRHAAFTLETGHNLCDASMHYEPEFRPDWVKENKDTDTPACRWGIFGQVNVSTTLEAIRDGTSNTILVGELQRITDWTPSSKDGWSIGGPATLFTTGAMVNLKQARAVKDTTLTFVDSPTSGKLMNNGFFGSPGSEHFNGANYGFADGHVQFLNSTVDPNIFSILGSMADGTGEPSDF
jgi:prepilin-type processing-associated H-X9-DG protein